MTSILTRAAYVEQVVRELLHTQKCRIRINPNIAQGDTSLAWSDPPRNDILLRPEYPTAPDLVLAVAHELRHIWQYHHGMLDDRLRDKPTSDDKTNYNMLPSEVDANAFAAIIVQELCGVKPLWRGLPQKCIEAIAEAERKILDELN